MDGHIATLRSAIPYKLMKLGSSVGLQRLHGAKVPNYIRLS